MHPSSRGNVHITSSNPSDKPSVDPAYLSSTVDRDLLVHAVRFGKKVHDSEPLKGFTTSYVEPPWEDDEECEGEGEESGEGGVSDEELREYVKNGLEPIYHPVSIPPGIFDIRPFVLTAGVLHTHIYIGWYCCHVPA
jgi:choline dehydrogenase-like flavoprotein